MKLPADVRTWEEGTWTAHAPSVPGAYGLGPTAAAAEADLLAALEALDEHLRARLRSRGVDLDAVADFCRRHRVRRFSLFGSILRADFGDDSDVDVLIDMDGKPLGFHEECRMLDDLEAMFVGRKIDLVEVHLVVALLRDEILNTAVLVWEMP